MRETEEEQGTVWKGIGICSEGKGGSKQPSRKLVGH